MLYAQTLCAFLLLSVIRPIAVLGLQISMLSVVAELCLASCIVKISLPSNILSLLIGIANVTKVFPRSNLTFLVAPSKSIPPVSHYLSYNTCLTIFTLTGSISRKAFQFYFVHSFQWSR